MKNKTIKTVDNKKLPKRFVPFGNFLFPSVFPTGSGIKWGHLPFFIYTYQTKPMVSSCINSCTETNLFTLPTLLPQKTKAFSMFPLTAFTRAFVIQ